MSNGYKFTIQYQDEDLSPYQIQTLAEHSAQEAGGYVSGQWVFIDKLDKAFEFRLAMGDLILPGAVE